MSSSERCLEAFGRVVARTGLRKNASVVALSGGSDSLALLWLTRAVFDNVLAITVDHRLRPDSKQDANLAGELAKDLGVDHCVLSVDWGGTPPTHNAIQNPARNHRYKLILDKCREESLNALMMGHQLNDQIETMLLRMRKASSLDGLMGIRPFTRWINFPDILIVRPLLTCFKEDLQNLCHEQGLKWVEDLSNHTPFCVRNRVRELLKKRSSVTRAALQLHTDLYNTGELVRARVGELLSDLPVLNKKYGFISLNRRRLLEQPRYVVWRLLTILGLYLTGEPKSTHYKLLEGIWTSIMYEGRTAFFSRTLLVPVHDKERDGEDVILVCRAPTRTSRTVCTRIEYDTPLLWGNCWELTLTHAQDGLPSADSVTDEHYFVQQFQSSDIVLAKQGRGVSLKLPHTCVCSTLPVLVDSKRDVVAIPHFGYVRDSCSIQVDVSFRPPVSLDVYTLVNQYHS